MSAIAGIYHRYSRPVEHTDLERMLAILSHRGMDDKGIWKDGPVGLGHRMLWTTPESLNEKLPLRNQTSGLAITADARIDNREELIAALSLGSYPPQCISDSQLILASYEKWGERCPEKLLGDFAFAIWDEHEQVLFCARDQIGVKPFYYCFTDAGFFFATEIKALLCLPCVPRQLNERRVAEYLASIFTDTSTTFYKNIARLPPAHSVAVSCEQIRLHNYWSLDPSRELRLESDAAYTEAFRELFIKSVGCRLRSAFAIGSSLSGGLDSSSVSCVAQQALAQAASQLRTFSIVFDDLPQCDERPFINRITAQGGFEPYFISGDRMRPLKHMEQILWHQDEPFYAPGLYSSWELYHLARQQGVRVLLDGHDGDGTVSHGDGRLDELAHAGQWLRLAIEARGLAKVYGDAYGKTVWRYVRQCKVDPLFSKFPAIKHMHSTSRALYRRMRFRDAPSKRSSWQDIVDRDFAQRVGLPELYGRWRQAHPASAWGERQTHYRLLSGGLQVFALEVFDRAAGAASIDLRHPFCDKRLLEFCLSLPSEQKLNRGWTRLILRRAMRGFLPAEVQWRVHKTDFFPRFSYGLLVDERERLGTFVLSDLESIKAYVDVSALRRLHERLSGQQSSVKPREVFTLWRAFSLALWLQYVREKGGVYEHSR